MGKGISADSEELPGQCHTLLQEGTLELTHTQDSSLPRCLLTSSVHFWEIPGTVTSSLCLHPTGHILEQVAGA